MAAKPCKGAVMQQGSNPTWSSLRLVQLPMTAWMMPQQLEAHQRALVLVLSMPSSNPLASPLLPRRRNLQAGRWVSCNSLFQCMVGVCRQVCPLYEMNLARISLPCLPDAFTACMYVCHAQSPALCC
jgi:hypothetical protein